LIESAFFFALAVAVGPTQIIKTGLLRRPWI